MMLSLTHERSPHPGIHAFPYPSPQIWLLTWVKARIVPITAIKTAPTGVVALVELVRGIAAQPVDVAAALERRARWSQQELAAAAGVGLVTIHQLGAGISRPRNATLDVVKRALERAGVEFIDENGGGPGVRLRKRTQS